MFIITLEINKIYMTREIKFRAWDKERELMRSIMCIEMVGGISVKVQVGEMNDVGTWLFNEEVELMQFTGLKDKNGVEIYEGDIVKGVMEFPQLTTMDSDENCNFKMGGYVFYDHIGFSLTAIQSMCDPEREGMCNYFDFIGDCGEIFGEMEIIGNIYQNQELLK